MGREGANVYGRRDPRDPQLPAQRLHTDEREGDGVLGLEAT